MSDHYKQIIRLNIKNIELRNLMSFSQIMATVPGCYHKPVLRLPIVIGSSPIHDDLQHQRGSSITTQTLMNRLTPQENGVIVRQPAVSPNSNPRRLSDLNSLSHSPCPSTLTLLPSEGKPEKFDPFVHFFHCK